MNGRSGVVILDKPRGLTSNGVLSRLKRLLGRPKMGFLGTLDPLATGVLPIFVGKATKLIPAFEGLEKAYRVTIRLGETTDTYDAEGIVLSRSATDHLTAEQVKAAVLAFEGEQQQRPPDFSAIKHDGVPAYRLAREGKDVPETWRMVVIRDLVVESIALPQVTFSLVCSAGTYMRSLAHDIGERLGVGAHVAELRRLRCGDSFTLERSLTLDAIKAAAERGDWSFLHDPVPWLGDHLPYPVGPEEAAQVRHGNRVPLRAEIALGSKVKAIGQDGALLAVGEVVPMGRSGLGFQPTKVLV